MRVSVREREEQRECMCVYIYVYIIWLQLCCQIQQLLSFTILVYQTYLELTSSAVENMYHFVRRQSRSKNDKICYKYLTFLKITISYKITNGVTVTRGVIINRDTLVKADNLHMDIVLLY